MLVAHSSRYATTTTIVTRADGTSVLIDPSFTAQDLADTAADVAELGLTVVAGFATHAHHDHVLWHPALPDVPRYASAAATSLARQEHAANLGALGAGWPSELGALVGVLTPISGELWPGVHLLTHDGHSNGHTALWFAEIGVLVAGDMLSDVEIPLATETGLPAYRHGLDVLRPAVESAEVVIPGHGSVGTDPLARWEADERYLTGVAAGHDVVDPRLQHPVSGPDNRAAHEVHLRLRAE